VAGSVTTGWFLGGGVSSADPLTTSLSGNVYSVILALSGAVWYAPFVAGTGNGWQTWVPLGGVFQGASPAALGSQLYLAGRDTGDNLWWYGGAWDWIGNQGLAAGNLIATPR